MNNKLSFIFLVVIIFSMTGVIAPPNFEVTGEETEGIQIFYPEIQFLKVNESFDAQVYVINRSTNLELPNTAYTCKGHLWNAQGVTIHDTGPWSLEADGREQEYIFGPGNFTEEGLYNLFYIYCNTSNHGSAVEGYYLLTGNGKELPGDFTILGFIILLLIILSGSVIIIVKSMGHLIQQNFDLMDLAYNWGAFFALLGSLRLANIYLGSLEVIAWLDLFIIIYAVPMVIVPIIAFILSLFKAEDDKKEEAKKW